MAEPIKGDKLSLRQILDEIVEDEAFSEEERRMAFEKSLELEYQEWRSRQTK